MAIELLEAFTTDFLENENLLGLYIVGKNGCLYNCAIYVRGANLNGSTVLDEEHFVELDSLIFLGCKTVDKDFRASFYFELLPCNINNCVHY